MPGYTKLYVLRAGTVAPQFAFDPWIGTWDRSGNASVLMDGAKFGSVNALISRNEGAVTDPYSMGVIRAVSRKLLPQTFGGTVDMVLGVREADASHEMYTRLHLFVYNGTDDTVLGTLLTYTESAAGDTEWSDTLTGTDFTSPQSLSAVTVPNDGKDYYLVAEFGTRSYSGTQGTSNLRYGAVDTDLQPLADLSVGSTSTTTLAGFFQFSTAVQIQASRGDTYFVSGTMLVPGADVALNGGPEVAAILSTTDGSILGYWHELPTAETGDNIPSGIFAINAQASPGGDVVAIRLYDDDNQEIETVLVSTLAAGSWGAFSPIRSDGDRTFYALQITTSTPATLHAINDAGVAVGSWTMPTSGGRGCTALAVARDGSKVYFGFRTGNEACNGIGRFDLAGAGTELTELVPTSAGLNFGRDLLCTADGDIICTRQQGAPTFDWEIRRYGDDGTLKQTIALPTGSATGDAIELAQDPTDALTFWARLYPSTTVSTWKQFLISDGSELTSFNVTLNNGSDQTYVPNSCPFLIYPTSAAGTGIIGPLAWVHRTRRIPGSPATFITDTYSDIDMQCPASWENGFKEGLVQRWGTAERAASHPWTGEWQGSTFDYQIAEKAHRFRAQIASADDRYWNEAETVRMTTRENRANLGTPYTVFVGPIVEAQPSGRDVWDITLGDVVSQGMLSDQAQVPWRQIRDGFLSTLDSVSENLDRDAAEPILYGALIRDPDDTGSPSTSDGLRVKPIYLGIDTIDGLEWHVWLVCGHATQNLEIFVDGVQQIEFPVFSTWMIPHHAEHQAEFGAPYQDVASDTYGTIRRYTLIYGNVGRTDPDACAAGDAVLTAAVWGIEDVGDGSGTLITDRFEQYKHFLVNYVANGGPQSYQSGDWLSNPNWDLFDGPVEKVEESSFDAAIQIANNRTVGGYIGAAAIGVNGERASAKKWIADWNRSCACRFIVTHLGQMRIFLLHPTDAAKAAGVLYTDAYEVLEDSFRTEIKWDEQATAIHYKSDFYSPTGAWLTNGVVEDTTESTNYGRTIPSEPREYPFAPGLQAEHLAILELRIRKHPPRYIRLDGTIGPDPVTDESLGYRDGGDYIRYEHYDAVQETREIRMAQVVACGVKVGPRVTYIVAIDCDDLIGYDDDGSPGA